MHWPSPFYVIAYGWLFFGAMFLLSSLIHVAGRLQGAASQYISPHFDDMIVLALFLFSLLSLISSIGMLRVQHWAIVILYWASWCKIFLWPLKLALDIAAINLKMAETEYALILVSTLFGSLPLLVLFEAFAVFCIIKLRAMRYNQKLWMTP